MSGFIFPDDEELIQAEFEKNIPFALVGRAVDPRPGRPGRRLVGLDAPDLVADPFDVSYGTDQQVAVIGQARRCGTSGSTTRSTAARPRTSACREWDGGERYGDTHDDYYAEFRGTVTGARPGDEVEVWFTGAQPRRRQVASRRAFTYTVHDDIGGDVLVLAAEDVTGLSPVQGVHERASTPTSTPRR